MPWIRNAFIVPVLELLVMTAEPTLLKVADMVRYEIRGCKINLERLL